MSTTANDRRLDEVGRAIALTVAHAPAATAMFDRDMRYIAASQKWRDEYRLGDVRLVGRSHYEVFPDLPERWKSIHRRGLAGESLGSDNDLFVRAHGEVQTVRWTLEPWRTMDGSIGGIIIASENLTIVQAEAAARELAARELHALFEQHVTGIVVTDWHGNVLRANQRYAELIRRDLGEIVGHRFDRAAQATDRIELFDGFAQLRAGACRTVQGRHRVANADGSTTWLKHEMSMLDPGLGRPVMMVMFVSDATARVELERHQREADRLAALAVLGASLGHDMNNVLLPLRANLNAVEALVRSLDRSPAIERSIGSIREGIAYLQHLADGMHHLASDPEANAPVRPATRMSAWWRSTEPLVRAIVPGPGNLEVRIASRLPSLAIAEHDLTRAMMNLVANARDAVRERHGSRSPAGCIRIEAARSNHSGRSAVRLSIADNGAGMTESVRRRAGEPFFTTKRSGNGTGLGLCAVRRAVEMAGGALLIDSAADFGTTVSLVIPAALGL